jgi:hypothetical protein
MPGKVDAFTAAVEDGEHLDGPATERGDAVGDARVELGCLASTA